MRTDEFGQTTPRMNQLTEDQVEEAEQEKASSGSRSGLVVRILLPLVLLAAGGGSYVWFSKEPPQVAEPRPKPKPLEVRVSELKRLD